MFIIDRILSLLVPALSSWGYTILLLSSILESSPFFGLLVPGQTIIIVGGFLSKLRILNLGYTIIIVAIGSIIGDLIGYLLGRKYGYSFIRKYGRYIFFKPEHFEKTRKIMNSHPGKILILGRFNSLTRAFAPFVAGSSNLSFFKFLNYNIIGGIALAIAFVMIGYIFGSGYELASKYLSEALFIALLVTVLFILIYRFINKRKHIFTKYNLYALIINLSSLYVLSKMIDDVIGNELITRLDFWISTKVVLLWNPLLNRIMIFITNIVNLTNLFILCLILFAVLIYKKKWYNSLLLFFSMAGGLFFELLIKQIIQRARPENALINVSGYSFPSGHATMAVIFFSLLIYSFKDDIKNITLRNLFIFGNIALFLMIGISRIYLNVHWFSDVIAGLSLGLFWLTLLILVFKVVVSWKKRKSHANYLK